MQAWIIEWSNLLNPDDNKVAGSMIEAVIREDLGLSQIMLPKNYLDFSNVFDKIQANMLL